MADSRVLVRWARPLGLDPATRTAATSALTGQERSRLDDLRHQDDRDRFAVGHVLLRVLVGELTGVPASDVQITARCSVCGGPHGRPQTVLPRSAGGRDGGVRLSLAHAGDRVLAAATRLGPVGVDVEPIAAQAFADWPGFDDVAFSDADGAAVDVLAPAERPAARAALWVRQEAAVKAGLDPAADGQLVWLDCGPGYAACLVLGSPDPITVTATEWPPGSLLTR